MATPRVSVIIATYNRSAVLACAITSVLRQTMGDFELLVIGDGCTDDSAQVVQAIDDPRVRWINLPENCGHQFGPNNRGLQEARGEFIAYLGHDDLWLPHHLQCATDALEKANAALAHTLMASISPGQEVGMPIVPVAGIGSAPSCSVYRRVVTEKIGGWRDYRTINVAPEFDLFRRAVAAGFKAVFVPRLTAIKFPARVRKNVYRDNSSREQAVWLEQISAADFEPTYLAQMIASDQVVRAMPARKLIPILFEELKTRIAWRLTRRSGYRAFFWARNGAGIELQKRYKGIE